MLIPSFPILVVAEKRGACIDSFCVCRLIPTSSSRPSPSLPFLKAGFTFAILVVISVMFPVANTLSHLVKEKELRIKEGLKMMGLTGVAHTASWVFHFACLFFCVSLLMVLASGTLFENRQDACCKAGIRLFEDTRGKTVALVSLVRDSYFSALDVKLMGKI